MSKPSRTVEGLSQTPDTSDIVFVDDKLDKRRDLWKGFKRSTGDADAGEKPVAGLSAWVKSGVIQSESLGTPDSRSLPGWIQRQAKAQNIDIDRQATVSLANFVGPNLRQLDNELQKLAVYASGRTDHGGGCAADGKRRQRGADLGPDGRSEPAQCKGRDAGLARAAAGGREPVLFAHHDRAAIPHHPQGEGCDVRRRAVERARHRQAGGREALSR